MNAYDFLLSLDRLDGRLIDETMDCLLQRRPLPFLPGDPGQQGLYGFGFPLRSASS